MKLLKFEASWCQPCKMMSKVIQETRHDVTVPIEAIDIDENQEMAVKYGIRGVPTMVLVDDNGQEVKRNVGLMRKDQLLAFLS